METTLETESIQTVLHAYVQAYLQADGSLLRQAFSDDTRLLSVETAADGLHDRLDITPMSAWLANLASRKAQGDFRRGRHEVLAIDVTGVSAIAKLRLTLPNLEFTDYLSLLKLGGTWKIVGKIYTARPIAT